MKVSTGQSQPEIVAAASLILYMVLGSPFLYQVLTHFAATGFCPDTSGVVGNGHVSEASEPPGACGWARANPLAV